jgi:hypothetical protein
MKRRKTKSSTYWELYAKNEDFISREATCTGGRAEQEENL